MRPTIAAAIAFTSAAAAGRAGSAPTWTIEPVNLGGNLGWVVDLEIGSDGSLHTASYQSDFPEAASYSARHAGPWLTPQPLEGAFYDLALDNQQRPHVVVRDEQGAALLRRSDDGSWQRVPVISSQVVGLSLDFDSFNRPHVSYINTANFTLYHAYLDGSEWVTEAVASRGTFGYANAVSYIALDETDAPNLIWSNFFDDMEHAVRSGESYVFRSIGDGFGSSTAFDADNNLHLSMVTERPYQLAHAVFDGNSWTRDIVDARFADEGAIAIDAMNQPHIVYGVDRGAGPITDKLLHAAWDGSEWIINPITTWPSLSNGPEAEDFQIDEDNRMHVVFSDDSKNIYYATAMAPEPGALSLFGLALLLTCRKRRVPPRVCHRCVSGARGR